MKSIVLVAVSVILLAGCGGAKKAEAERKRTQQKMEELDQNKQQFEMKNPK